MLHTFLARICIDENVEEEWIDVEVDGFPFEKQLGQKAETLAVELTRGIVNRCFSENLPVLNFRPLRRPIVHLDARRSFDRVDTGACIRSKTIPLVCLTYRRWALSHHVLSKLSLAEKIE